MRKSDVTKEQHPSQVRRSQTFSQQKSKRRHAHQFSYHLDFKKTDFRKRPDLYRVGIGEQGVLLVEPYKSEILPFWKFKTPKLALQSARKIYRLFVEYKKQQDFVGMDMARKFLQMGYTRSRRYANHSSGRKYDGKGQVLPFRNDAEKAQSADIFKNYWNKVEEDPLYSTLKIFHQLMWKTK